MVIAQCATNIGAEGSQKIIPNDGAKLSNRRTNLTANVSSAFTLLLVAGHIVRVYTHRDPFQRAGDRTGETAC